MIKALILTAIACLLNIGAPIVNSSVALNVYEQQSDYIEIEKPKEKLVSYDDEHNNITLSINELNNYTFNNLAIYLNDDDNGIVMGGLNQSLVTYNLAQYSYDDYARNTYLHYVNGDNYIDFNMDIEDSNYAKFVLFTEDNFTNFEYEIILDLDNTSYYDEFKQAIEADIQANTQSENMPSITDIFNEIASAVTNFISTLVSAFNGVTTLFWDASANTGAGGFTFLGVLVLIGCGVGLVYLAYRVIKGLMHRV